MPRPSSQTGGGGFYKMLMNNKRDNAIKNQNSENLMNTLEQQPSRSATPDIGPRYKKQNSKIVEGKQIMVNDLIKNMRTVDS